MLKQIAVYGISWYPRIRLYYDNIGYADHTRIFSYLDEAPLKNIYLDLFSTMLVPKADELTYMPYRRRKQRKSEKVL